MSVLRATLTASEILREFDGSRFTAYRVLVEENAQTWTVTRRFSQFHELYLQASGPHLPSSRLTMPQGASCVRLRGSWASDTADSLLGNSLEVT
jgi:hypothetical protein